ncbi:MULTISPECIES: hypothetical protein [Agrococcus]|uniref:Helix-turn-helix domain-containing protein n=1 Tax=Agrococcus pavilionensis RW1 TaxID=1330458 RepID=U1LQZ4_9MICO|nr:MULTISPECIES: hypothetical protein [Agrococcus]ERG64477.1 hypothetical protein L332_08440 [Agrococcus pavilionensis RW1]MBO1769963.1 hypothetical protein [Agrococcus sp. TF02-05]
MTSETIPAAPALGLTPSAVSEGFRERLGAVLQRRDVALDPREFVDILLEASADPEPLTAGERSFLMQHAGVEEAKLSDRSLRRAAAVVGVSTSMAQARAGDAAITTAEAAALTGIAPSNIRRLIAGGRLLTFGLSKSGSHLLPRWQFTEGGVVPGIREVVRALPVDYHPLDIATFMQAPVVELGGRAPAEWLSGGGSVDRVVELAAERAWE